VGDAVVTVVWEGVEVARHEHKLSHRVGVRERAVRVEHAQPREEGKERRQFSARQRRSHAAQKLRLREGEG